MNGPIVDYDAAWINDKNFQQFKGQGVGLWAIWTHVPVPEFPIASNTRHVKPEVLERIQTALLERHEKDPAALQAIDPKYQRWVSVRWQDDVPVKNTIDALHGEAFYGLTD